MTVYAIMIFFGRLKLTFVEWDLSVGTSPTIDAQLISHRVFCSNCRKNIQRILRGMENCMIPDNIDWSTAWWPIGYVFKPESLTLRERITRQMESFVTMRQWRQAIPPRCTRIQRDALLKVECKWEIGCFPHPSAVGPDAQPSPSGGGRERQ